MRFRLSQPLGSERAKHRTRGADASTSNRSVTPWRAAKPSERSEWKVFVGPPSKPRVTASGRKYLEVTATSVCPPGNVCERRTYSMGQAAAGSAGGDARGGVAAGTRTGGTSAAGAAVGGAASIDSGAVVGASARSDR